MRFNGFNDFFRLKSLILVFEKKEEIHVLAVEEMTNFDKLKWIDNEFNISFAKTKFGNIEKKNIKQTNIKLFKKKKLWKDGFPLHVDT